MKKKILIVLAIAMLVMLMPIQAMAGDITYVQEQGIYCLQCGNNVSVTVLDAENEEINSTEIDGASTALLNIDGSYTFYSAPKKLKVSVANTKSDKQYIVMLVTGFEFPGAASEILYVDQKTGNAEGDLEFILYPQFPSENVDLTLWVTSNDTAFSSTEHKTTMKYYGVPYVDINLNTKLIFTDNNGNALGNTLLKDTVVTVKLITDRDVNVTSGEISGQINTESLDLVKSSVSVGGENQEVDIYSGLSDLAVESSYIKENGSVSGSFSSQNETNFTAGETIFAFNVKAVSENVSTADLAGLVNLSATISGSSGAYNNTTTAYPYAVATKGEGAVYNTTTIEELKALLTIIEYNSCGAENTETVEYGVYSDSACTEALTALTENAGESTTEVYIKTASGCICSVNIGSVLNDPIESIQVSANPTKIIYTAYDNFESDGLKIILTTENGKTQELSASTGYKLYIGDTELTSETKLQYGTSAVTAKLVADNTKTADIAITVNKKASGVVFGDSSVEYNGQSHTITATQIPENISASYVIKNSESQEVSQAINAGEYTVTVSFSGSEIANYSDLDGQTKTLTITPKTLTASIATIGTQIYTGSALEPSIVVKDGETVISADEYNVSYLNNVNVGTATVSVTDKDGGNYNVTASATFSIIDPVAKKLVLGKNVYFNSLSEALASVYSGDTITICAGKAAGSATINKAITFNVVLESGATVSITAGSNVDLTKTEKTGYTEYKFQTKSGSSTPTPSPSPTPTPTPTPTPSVKTYTITAVCDNYSQVQLSEEDAEADTEIIITLSFTKGYELDSLKITYAGTEIEPTENSDGTYSFAMPKQKVTVTVTSKKIVEEIKINFTDVKEDSYYYEAVRWAVKNSVTNGVTETEFMPGNLCTRAQVVTFLYRAAGSPECTSAKTFADVPEDAYYHNAVIWAYENGITLGKTEELFEPNAVCTRAQVVTFLARFANAKTSESSYNFKDVKASSYYADAVYWAANNGITLGTDSEGTIFNPNGTCTRAHVVSFLYRYFINVLEKDN